MVEFQLFQLGKHVGIHSARDFGSFNFLIGFRKTELFFYFLANLEEFRLLIMFGKVNGLYKEPVDLPGEFVVCNVKFFREGGCVKFFQFGPDLFKFIVDFFSQPAC